MTSRKQQTVGAIRSAFSVEPQNARVDQILATLPRIDEPRRSAEFTESPPIKARTWAPWVAAASVVAVLLIGAFVWQPWIPSSPPAASPALRQVSVGSTLRADMYFGFTNPEVTLTPEQVKEITALIERLPQGATPAGEEDVHPGFRKFVLINEKDGYSVIDVSKTDVILRPSVQGVDDTRLLDDAGVVYSRLRELLLPVLDARQALEIPE